jgi:high-affinity iron transporter
LPLISGRALHWKRVVAVAIALALAAPRANAATPEPWARELHRIVALLQYIEEEYDEALEEGLELELREQQKLAAMLVPIASTTGPRGSAFLTRLASIRERIDRSADPVGVSRDCAELAHDIVAVAAIETSPTTPPNIARGRTIFQSVCATCHNHEQLLARPDVAALVPEPPTFLASDLMNHLSPFRAFNFLSFGIPGTAMAPFESALSESDRWSVAFYLQALRHPPCEAARPKEPLARTATMTDQDIVAEHGEAGLACLRWAPSPTTSAPPAMDLLRGATRNVRGLALLAVAALLGLVTAFAVGARRPSPPSL